MGKRKTGDAPKQQKRGKQSHVVGKRAEFLHAELEAYCKHSAAGTTRTWYPKLFRAYWQRFPPDLPFDQDPPDDSPSPTSMPQTGDAPMNDVPPPNDASSSALPANDVLAGTGADVDDSHLTAEEKAAKKKVVEQTELKIKNWFNYQRTHSGGDQNPWSKWLRAKLKPVEDERRPRRLLNFQVYMQDEEKNAEVNRVFSDRYPEHMRTKNSLKYRAQIARELFEAEPEEVQREFRRKAEDDFEEAMEEYQKEVGVAEVDGGELDEEARAEARIRLHATVKPLLAAIRKHTGYQVTLIAGGVINGKLDVRSVHAGTVDGKNEDGQDGTDFTRWDPKGYSANVMKQFWRYLAAANGTPGLAGAPTADAMPDTTDATPDTTMMTTTGDSSAIPAPTMPPAPPPPSSQPPAMPPSPSRRGSSPTPPPVGVLLGGNGPTAEGMDVDPPPDDEEPDEEEREGTPLRFSSPLQRQLKTLTPGARAVRMAQLTRISEWELVREENMARNKELLEKSGTSAAVAELMAEVRAAMKRKAGDEGEGTKQKRAKESDGNDGGDYSENDDDASDGASDVASREGTPTPRGGRGGARGRGRARGGGGVGRKGGKKKKVRVSQLTVEEDGGVPKWATDAQVSLLAGGGGDVWAGVVNMWWDCERAQKFQGPGKGKGTSKRPNEVSGWIGRARSGGPHPAIVDVFSFASRWWNWWVAINPEWRIKRGNRLVREGEGAWDSLAQTGPNGMLNVLICLRWWYDALKGDERAMGDWKEALADVEWALKGILAAERLVGATTEV